MRSFGTEISGNRRLTSELSPELCSAILYGLSIQKSPTQLATEFNVTCSTIYWTKNWWLATKTTKSRPRKGRPRKSSQSSKQYIYWLTHHFPTLSWRALAAGVSGSPSISTIKWILKGYHIKKWKSKKRIPLTRDTAWKWFWFARLWHQYVGWKDWMFSDECSVQRKASHGVQFVFWYQNEGFREDLVNLTFHGRPISQMVWGSIWLGGWSKLVVMEQDYISNQGGFTANSYIKTLEDGMVEHYRPGLIFQQDNT